MHTRIRNIVLTTSIVAIFMFGFTFALAPLYNAFCKVSGLNTGIRTQSFPDLTRQITVQFVVTNNGTLPWDFFPQKNILNVHPDENNRIVFHAKNNTKKSMTIQAIPSFSPPLAAQFFHKTQCFCFTQQTLAGGMATDFPMIFRIDKEIPADMQTITLSYTLFDVTSAHAGKST